MAAVGNAGPGTKIIFGANEEYSSSYPPLKLLFITVVQNFMLGGCKVKFT